MSEQDVSISAKEYSKEKKDAWQSYVPPQFISLCLESIADVWRRDWLRAVRTTSKVMHTLQEEYQILIKSMSRWIYVPQLQRWRFQHSHLLTHCQARFSVFALNYIRLAVLHLLPCDRGNQYTLNIYWGWFPSVGLGLKLWCGVKVFFLNSLFYMVCFLSVLPSLFPHSVQHVLHRGSCTVNADSFRWFPANQNQWAHGRCW